MVLFKPSSTGVGRLEIYSAAESSYITDQKKVGRQKTPERKVVRLSDCLSVTSAPKESYPAGCTAFYLNTIQTTYTLASPSTQDWLNALSLLAFQVSHLLTAAPLHPFLSVCLFLIWERRGQSLRTIRDGSHNEEVNALSVTSVTSLILVLAQAMLFLASYHFEVIKQR